MVDSWVNGDVLLVNNDVEIDDERLVVATVDNLLFVVGNVKVDDIEEVEVVGDGIVVVGGDLVFVRGIDCFNVDEVEIGQSVISLSWIVPDDIIEVQSKWGFALISNNRSEGRWISSFLISMNVMLLSFRERLLKSTSVLEKSGIFNNFWCEQSISIK